MLYVKRRRMLYITVLDLMIDWDGYGRGVLEVTSIYHLRELGVDTSG
jgi:hypothetical protein